MELWVGDGDRVENNENLSGHLSSAKKRSLPLSSGSASADLPLFFRDFSWPGDGLRKYLHTVRM